MLNPTISKLIKLRLAQAGRISQSIGLVYILIAVFLLSGIIFKFLEDLHVRPNPLYGLYFGILPFFIQMNRKDQYFLKTLDVNIRLLFILEYLILSLPFLCILLAFKNFQASGVLLLCSVFSAFIPILKQNGNTFRKNLSLGFIPIHLFEIRMGIRKHFFTVLLLFLPALIFSFYMGVMPVFVFFFTLICTTFYDDIEDRPLIEEYATNSFIHKKIKSHIIFFQMLLLPHYLMFLIFHSSYWYFLPICILVSSMIFAFAIVYKYKVYYPGRVKAFNGTAMAIFSFSMLNPLFAPLTIFMLIHYYRKAIKNMQLFYAGI